MNKHAISDQIEDHKTEPSLVNLLKKLVSQTSDIISGEVTLMKAEISEAGQQVKKGTVSLVLSLIFVIAGLSVTLIGCASLLSQTLPYWMSCLIIGGPVLLIGIGLLMSGINSLKAKEFQPKRTIASVESDIQVLKGERQ